MTLKAPFPWFGGKSRVADLVWSRFGEVGNYVEPFAGSLAVLLGRPSEPHVETVNDLNGFLANFWRAVKHAPGDVARYSDSPVNECDLHARHVWLLQRAVGLPERLMGDPDYFDRELAGYWVWGLCCWIGSGWCSGQGAWWPDDSGALTKGNAGRGVNRKLPHLGDAGRGVNRQLPHLGDAGQGVNRKLPHLGNAGRLVPWMQALSARIDRVRVACGDWTRVCGPSVARHSGQAAVFLDPPYDGFGDLYTHGVASVAEDVRKWAVESGEGKMRIALCGYEGMDIPSSWECVSWKANGGFGSTRKDGVNANANRERLWFSPACIRP
jgi:hypothetical protein